MTTPNGAVPNGGRSSQQVFELATITPPAMANPDLFANAEGARGNFFGNILSGFISLGQGIGQMLDDLAKALFGGYDGENGPLLEIQDGQKDLVERVDLLGESGFCSVVMGSNFRIGPARNRALPFNTLVAPPKGASLVTIRRAHTGNTMRDEWAIRLDRVGLWQANANFSHRGDAPGDSYGEIVVLRPDLTVYSVTALPQAESISNLAAPRGGMPVNLFKMFVVDEPGYYVQVRWWWASPLGIRTVGGGAAYSQFAVTQWSDEIEGSPNENPNGTIEDGSSPDP